PYRRPGVVWSVWPHAAARFPSPLPDREQASLTMKKFCVSLTFAKNDSDKATVAFVVANAAVASDQETIVFLSTEAVRLSQAGYADDIHEESFPALQELMPDFVKDGGKLWASEPSL